MATLEDKSIWEDGEVSIMKTLYITNYLVYFTYYGCNKQDLKRTLFNNTRQYIKNKNTAE